MEVMVINEALINCKQSIVVPYNLKFSRTINFTVFTDFTSPLEIDSSDDGLVASYIFKILVHIIYQMGKTFLPQPLYNNYITYSI